LAAAVEDPAGFAGSLGADRSERRRQARHQFHKPALALRNGARPVLDGGNVGFREPGELRIHKPIAAGHLKIAVGGDRHHMPEKVAALHPQHHRPVAAAGMPGDDPLVGLEFEPEPRLNQGKDLVADVVGVVSLGGGVEILAAAPAVPAVNDHDPQGKPLRRQLLDKPGKCGPIPQGVFRGAAVTREIKNQALHFLRFLGKNQGDPAADGIPEGVFLERVAGDLERLHSRPGGVGRCRKQKREQQREKSGGGRKQSHGKRRAGGSGQWPNAAESLPWMFCRTRVCARENFFCHDENDRRFIGCVALGFGHRRGVVFGRMRCFLAGARGQNAGCSGRGW
jgi:hypothetical protein